MLAKKLTPERVSVTIEEGKLSVIIRDETGQQEYDLTTQLYGPIVTSESRWELLSTKVSRTCVSWSRRLPLPVGKSANSLSSVLDRISGQHVSCTAMHHEDAGCCHPIDRITVSGGTGTDSGGPGSKDEPP